MADLERVHCPGCKAQTTFKASSLPVDGLPGAVAVGLVCDECAHRQHAYFDTPALEAKRREVRQARTALAQERGQRSAEQRLEEYKATVAAFSVLFDSVQADVKRRLRERDRAIVKPD